jgi:hypothetical protein
MEVGNVAGKKELIVWRLTPAVYILLRRRKEGQIGYSSEHRMHPR